MSPWITALAGGVLLGGAAALLYIFHGRIAGISGIFGTAINPRLNAGAWRWAFVGGLVLAGLGARLVAPETVPVAGSSTPLPLLIAAGLLVGFGTRMGNGCTSGHGVCGIGRGSTRSLSATIIFMAVAVGVVFITRHLVAGGVS